MTGGPRVQQRCAYWNGRALRLTDWPEAKNHPVDPIRTERGRTSTTHARPPAAERRIPPSSTARRDARQYLHRSYSPVIEDHRAVACQGDGTGFLPRERDHLAS